MTAQEEYAKKRKEINKLISALQSKVNKNPGVVHWGHVGDLGHIKAKLEELL